MAISNPVYASADGVLNSIYWSGDYTDIDDPAGSPDDTTTEMSIAGGQEASNNYSFEFDISNIGTDNINSVTVYFRVRLTSIPLSPHPQTFKCNSSGTQIEYGSTAAAGSIAYQTYTETYATAPGGGAWTESALNDAQFGIFVPIFQGNFRKYAYVTQVYYTIDYTGEGDTALSAPTSLLVGYEQNPSYAYEIPGFQASFVNSSSTPERVGTANVVVCENSDMTATVNSFAAGIADLWGSADSTPMISEVVEYSTAYGYGVLETDKEYYWAIQWENSSAVSPWSYTSTFSGFDRKWVDDNYTHRYKLLWDTPHPVIPTGYTQSFNIQTGNREKIASNGYFNESIQASGGHHICYFNGKTHVVYWGEIDIADGYAWIWIVTKDHSTGEWGEPYKIANSGTKIDSHFFPSITVDNFGFIYVAYSGHPGNVNLWRSRLANQSGSLSTDTQTNTWINPADGLPYPKTFSAPSPPGSYPVLWNVPDYNRVYMYNRATPDYVSQLCDVMHYTADTGHSWTSPLYFINATDSSSVGRAYCYGMRYEESINRLHVAYTINIGYTEPKGIWYAYSDYDTTLTDDWDTAPGFRLWKSLDGTHVGTTVATFADYSPMGDDPINSVVLSQEYKPPSSTLDVLLSSSVGHWKCTDGSSADSSNGAYAGESHSLHNTGDVYTGYKGITENGNTSYLVTTDPDAYVVYEGNNTALRGSAHSFTIEVIFKCSSDAATSSLTYSVLAECTVLGDGGVPGYIFCYGNISDSVPDRGKLTFRLSDGSNVVSSVLANTYVTDNKWHYSALVVDRDRDVAWVYLDGEVVSSEETDISSITGGIPGTGHNPAKFWFGDQGNAYIDELVVSSVAFSTAFLDERYRSSLPDYQTVQFVHNLVVTNSGDPIIFYEQKPISLNHETEETSLFVARASSDSWVHTNLSDEFGFFMRVGRSGVASNIDRDGNIRAYTVVNGISTKIAYPVSTGTYSDFDITGSTNAWAAINETVDAVNYSTFIDGSTGDTSSFTDSLTLPDGWHTTQSFSAYKIQEVGVSGIFYSTAGTAQAFLRQDSIDYYSSSLGLDTSYFEKSFIWSTVPGTGSTWTKDSAEAVEFGVAIEVGTNIKCYRLNKNIKILYSSHEERFGSEIYEFYSMDNGRSWSYKPLTQNSYIGVPIISHKEHTSNDTIELVWCSGQDVFYYPVGEEYGLNLSGANDLRLYYGSASFGYEIDRLIDYSNYDNTKVEFKVVDTVNANEVSGDYDYYVYFGNKNEESRPLSNPNNVYYWNNNIETAKEGSNLADVSDWVLDSGIARIYSSPPKHANHIVGGQKSICMSSAGGDGTDSRITYISSSSPLSNKLVSGWMWIFTAGVTNWGSFGVGEGSVSDFDSSFSALLQPVSLYAGWIDSSGFNYNESKRVGTQSFFRFDIYITDYGCGLEVNNDPIMYDRYGSLTSFDRIGFKSPGESYVDNIYIRDYITNSDIYPFTSFKDSYGVFSADSSSSYDAVPDILYYTSTSTIHRIDIGVKVVKPVEETTGTGNAIIKLWISEGTPYSVDNYLDSAYVYIDSATGGTTISTSYFSGLTPGSYSIKGDFYYWDGYVGVVGYPLFSFSKANEYKWGSEPTVSLQGIEAKGFQVKASLLGTTSDLFTVDAVLSYCFSFNTLPCFSGWPTVIRNAHVENIYSIESKKEVLSEWSGFMSSYKNSIIENAFYVEKQSDLPIENNVNRDSTKDVYIENIYSLESSVDTLLEWMVGLISSENIPLETLSSFENIKDLPISYISSQNIKRDIIIGYLNTFESNKDQEIEYLVPVIATQSIPLESIIKLASDRISLIEFKGFLNSSKDIIIEYFTKLEITKDLSIESLTQDNYLLNILIENVRNRTIDNDLPIGYISNVSIDNKIPIEHINKVINDNDLRIETLVGTEANRDLLIANIGFATIKRDIVIGYVGSFESQSDLNLEFLSPIIATHNIPLEHLIKAISDEDLLIEFKGFLNSSKDIIISNAKDLDNVFDLPIESLKNLEEKKDLTVEISKRILDGIDLPIGNISNITIDKNIPTEYIGSFLSDYLLRIGYQNKLPTSEFTITIESLRTIATSLDIPIAIQGQAVISPFVNVPIEFIGGASINNNVNIENRTSKEYDKDTLVDFINSMIAEKDSNIESLSSKETEKDTYIESLSSIIPIEKEVEIESLRSKDIDRKTIIDFTGSFSISSDLNIEALSAKDIAKDVNIENIYSLVSSLKKPIEYLNKIFPNKDINIDILKSIDANKDIPIDLSGGVTYNFLQDLPIEWKASIDINNNISIEAIKIIESVKRDTNIDYGIVAEIVKDVTIDYFSKISKALDIDIEISSKLESNIKTDIEYLLKASTYRDLPIEVVSTVVSSIINKNIMIEWLSSISKKEDILIDFGKKVEISDNVIVEYGQKTTANLDVFIEANKLLSSYKDVMSDWLKGTKSSAKINIDYSGWTQPTFNMHIDYGRNITLISQFPVESMIRIIREADIPVEWSGILFTLLMMINGRISVLGLKDSDISCISIKDEVISILKAKNVVISNIDLEEMTVKFIKIINAVLKGGTGSAS